MHSLEYCRPLPFLSEDLEVLCLANNFLVLSSLCFAALTQSKFSLSVQQLSQQLEGHRIQLIIEL